MLCPWPKPVISEVWARWLPQCVIKQQTASLNMVLPYWAPPRSGICAWHQTGFLRPFFMAFLRLSKNSTNKTREKCYYMLHQPDMLQVRNAGQHREKLSFSFLLLPAIVTHFKIPHYNVLARPLRCQLLDASKEQTLKTRYMYSLRKKWNWKGHDVFLILLLLLHSIKLSYRLVSDSFIVFKKERICLAHKFECYYVFRSCWVDYFVWLYFSK